MEEGKEAGFSRKTSDSDADSTRIRVVQWGTLEELYVGKTGPALVFVSLSVNGWGFSMVSAQNLSWMLRVLELEAVKLPSLQVNSRFFLEED